MKNFDKEIYAYALENAISHGKAMESAVLPKLFQHGLKKDKIGEVISDVKKIVSEVNGMKEKEVEFEKYKKYLKDRIVEDKGLRDLPNVSKKVVFRLAPFPSGSLHIGNTKTYLLNALYAEKYKGKIVLVIDDTIGSDEKGIAKDAYKLIPEAFDYLKVKYRKPIVYKSDRLKIYYKYAEELIEKDKAYVCSCERETLRENRVKERECGCRQFPKEVQMERWKKMFNAKPGDFVLRIKTSMTYPDPAFRDRVLFRISDKKHPRVGKKYRVWPLLEFSWAVDDHLLGITHIIRGKELMIEGKMQKYLWEIFGWRSPEMIYVGLVKLEGLVGKLSKSKAQREVASGEYSGWDDPRTWSVQSLARRGILAESIREFVENIGLNQKDIVIPVDDLYAINRKKIDSKADRYFFVKDPVEISVNGSSEIKEVKVKIHPDKKKMKTLKIGKDIFVAEEDFEEFKGKSVRLMHFDNIKLGKKSEFVSGEDKKIPKVHWVFEGVKTRVMMSDGVYAEGVAEPGIKKLKKGDVIQFERFGFCRFDGKREGFYEFWWGHR